MPNAATNGDVMAGVDDEGTVAYGNSAAAVAPGGGGGPVDASQHSGNGRPAAVSVFVGKTAGTSFGYGTIDIRGVGNGFGANRKPGSVLASLDRNRDGVFGPVDQVISRLAPITSNGPRAFGATLVASQILSARTNTRFAVPVPEPSTWAALTAAAALLVWRRKV